MSGMFSIFVQNKTSDSAAGVWLSMPTTSGKWLDALKKMNIGPDNPNDLIIRGYAFNVEQNERLINFPQSWADESTVSELNFLAERLEAMATVDVEKLAAIMESPNKLTGLGEMIDYTYNADCYVYKPELTNLTELGQYYWNESGETHLSGFDETDPDYRAYGEAITTRDQGDFSDFGYVGRDHKEEWIPHYEGKEVPEPYQLKIKKPAPFVLTAVDKGKKVEEILEQLEYGIKAVFDSDRYKQYLQVMSKFHDYSPGNTLLIAMQMPTASYVAGYNKWISMNRHVMGGQKAIKILAPMVYKNKREMEKLDPSTQKPIIGPDGKPVKELTEVEQVSFRVVNVFDVSQTDGEPLPTIGVDELQGKVEQYQILFQALEKTAKVPINFEKIPGSTRGYYHLVEKRIAINLDMSELQNLKTGIHEAAHAELHDVDLKAPDKRKQFDSATREVQAESVAYIVCQHYGLDTSDYSFAYIAGWSTDQNVTELKSSLKIISDAANDFIIRMDAAIEAILKEQEKELINEPETFTYEGITYNEEQYEQIMSGVEKELDVSVYADPKYSADQMNEIRLGLLRNLDVSIYAVPQYDAEQMHYIRRGLRNQVDVSLYADPKLSGAEMKEIFEKLIEPPEPVREEWKQVPEGTPNSFAIYQVRPGDDTRDYRFVNYEELERRGLEIDRKNYEHVYSAELQPLITLEGIYQRLNMDHPEGYKGHSLSVSDIIVINKNGEATAHYVDSFGYKSAPEFLTGPKSIAYLLDGEMYLYLEKKEKIALYTLSDRHLEVIKSGRINGGASKEFSVLRDTALTQYGLTVQNKEEISAKEYLEIKDKMSQQPTVKVQSEYGSFENDREYLFSGANIMFQRFDQEIIAQREDSAKGRYYKTNFDLAYLMDGRICHYTGRQDLGDGDGSLIDHIQAHANYYLNDPQWQSYFKSEGIDNERNQTYENTLKVIVPYLKIHNEIAQMESSVTVQRALLLSKENLTDAENTEISRYNAVMDAINEIRMELNMPLCDFELTERAFHKIVQQVYSGDLDKKTLEYKAAVMSEIETEAKNAGMTVDEYAKNDYQLKGEVKVRALAASEDLKEVLFLSQDNKVYIGDYENYQQGVYNNQDSSMTFVSDNPKVFSLIYGFFPESQEEATKSGCFSKDDFSELAGLLAGKLQNFKANGVTILEEKSKEKEHKLSIKDRLKSNKNKMATKSTDEKSKRREQGNEIQV